MITRTSKRVAAAALSISTLLALTACGGSEVSPAGIGSQSQGDAEAALGESIYQFDESRVADSEDRIPFVSANGSATIQLSDELKSVMPEGSQVAIDHFTLTAKAFSTGICRLDVGIAYTSDGLSALTAVPRKYQEESPHTNLMAGLTGRGGFDADDIVDSPPSDEEITKNAEYITRDFSHATFVRECSDDSEDGLVDLGFSYTEPDESGQLSEFAEVDIAVISDTQSSLEGAAIFIDGRTIAELSVTGKWAPPED